MTIHGIVVAKITLLITFATRKGIILHLVLNEGLLPTVQPRLVFVKIFIISQAAPTFAVSANYQTVQTLRDKQEQITQSNLSLLVWCCFI